MGFTFYGMKYVNGVKFHSSYSLFDHLIKDIIEKELEMDWFENVVVQCEEIQKLLEKLEEWMKTPRSNEFFQNHEHLSREYVRRFVDFLKKCDCFCKEEI